MNYEGSEYKIEVPNADWVHEVVAERFDNAIDLLTPNAIAYGGAIRDCIANKELVGDLDIAVSKAEFSTLSKSFLVNPRWVDKRHDGRTSETSKKSKSEIGSGDLAHVLAPMNAVTSFRNIDGQEVQLIRSKYCNKDPLSNAIAVARGVDIVCCGIIMTASGEVFEVVPGAHQDCIDGVLRVNKTSDTIYLDTLQSRVDKLVNRGWKNLINVEETIAEIKKKRGKEEVVKKSEDRGHPVTIDWQRPDQTKMTCVMTFRCHMPFSALRNLCDRIKEVAYAHGFNSRVNSLSVKTEIDFKIKSGLIGAYCDEHTFHKLRIITTGLIADEVDRARAEMSPTMRFRDLGTPSKPIKAGLVSRKKLTEDEIKRMHF